jgi:hypothetical protein
MLKALGEVNWLAVGAADIALFAFGAVWFMLVVARAYRIALELDAPVQPSALSIVVPFLCQTVVIITTAVLMRALGIMTYAAASQFGLIVGIGYLLPMVVNIAHNPKFPKPMFYSLINAPFFVLGSMISSTILVALG